MILFPLFLGVAISGCSNDGSGAAFENADGVACEPSTIDGTSACSGVLCEANQFCSQGACVAGCMSTLNCGEESYCDKVGSTDPLGAGVCRSCLPTSNPADDSNDGTVIDVSSGQGSNASGTCQNLVNNYNVYATDNNPLSCLGYGYDVCSVTDPDGKLTLTCFDGPDATDSMECTLDSDACTCTTTLVTPEKEGMLKVDFKGKLMTITFDGLLCKYLFDAS
ncbi:MAG: hypothetical protein IPJ88_16175 [Myxococcales bacterium]|nr:MAG: hypothetical protein IPJ88_16175 [Myxococcales bacterium]